MDKDFVYLNSDDSVVEVSKIMEEIRRFTCPVVNENKQLIGWVTSFDVTRGLREGNDKISEIMVWFVLVISLNYYLNFMILR